MDTPLCKIVQQSLYFLYFDYKKKSRYSTLLDNELRCLLPHFNKLYFFSFHFFFKYVYIGPVTAISAVSGFLVSTVGQKIYIWQFKVGVFVVVKRLDIEINIDKHVFCYK